MKTHTIGVLAFHGDVIEHIKTSELAVKNLNLAVDIRQVRTKKDLLSLQGLIIPGGESTTLYTLCEREGMFEAMKKIPAIFGTCAGAILMTREVLHKAPNQKTLECMDISVDRNAYGRQTESFEKTIQTALGPISAMFIRAPKIVSVGKSVRILAEDNNEILACEELTASQYLMACAFHPELTTSLFHEYFLKQALLTA